MSTKPVCPSCGSDRTSKIVWGMVTPDVMEEEDVVFGGCVVDGPADDRACRDCGHRWRVRPVPLQWPDPRVHADAERVEVSGTVGRVVLESTSPGDVWADFELIVTDPWPRLRCLAFPDSFVCLDVALEPGLEVRLWGLMSLSRPSGPELHVSEWF